MVLFDINSTDIGLSSEEKYESDPVIEDDYVPTGYVFVLAFSFVLCSYNWFIAFVFVWCLVLLAVILHQCVPAEALALAAQAAADA